MSDSSIHALKRLPIFRDDIKLQNFLQVVLNYIEIGSTYSFIRWYLIFCKGCMWFRYNQNHFIITDNYNMYGNGTLSYMAPKIYHVVFKGLAVYIFLQIYFNLAIFLSTYLERNPTMKVMQNVYGSHNHPPTGPSSDHLFISYKQICEQSTSLYPMKRPTTEFVLQSFQSFLYWTKIHQIV